MKKMLLAAIVVLGAVGAKTARPSAQECLSQWVYPGEDGRLVYVADDRGNQIPDFSNVGYRSGIVPIPYLPVRITLQPDPDSDDDGPRIQDAIDRVSSLPLDDDGFRGAVLLQAGEYRISRTLFVRASGVVLRGEGQDADTGTVLRATGVRPASEQSPLIVVQGSGSRQKVNGTEHNVIDDDVPVGASSFEVDSTDGLSVGNTIVVHRPSTAEWIHDINMDQLDDPWEPGSKNIDWDRVITSIDGHQVTVDAPLTTALEQQYGGGTVYKYTWDGRIENVGLESMRGISDFASPTDENHAWDFVRLNNLQNGWVRFVTAEHFAYAAVDVLRQAKWVTVDGCSMLDPISQITGGRRYSFNVVGQLVLVENAYARNGRHDFVLETTVAGPNVFFNSFAELTHDNAGPHQRWSSGVLFDNIVLPDGRIEVRNRGNFGTGHGWAGANQVIWNSTARGYLVESPQTAQNWVIGSAGPLLDDHHVAVGPVLPALEDSPGCPVAPQSLYLQQLADRLSSRQESTQP